MLAPEYSNGIRIRFNLDHVMDDTVQSKFLGFIDQCIYNYMTTRGESSCYFFYTLVRSLEHPDGVPAIVNMFLG